MNILKFKTHQGLCSGLIIILAWSAAPSVSAKNFTEFTGLGHLPIMDLTFLTGSTATDVSADGSVIVGNSADVGDTEGFYYTRSTGMVGLGSFLDRDQTNSFIGGNFVNGISADGRVIVGGSYGKNGAESFRYTKSEGMIGLGVGHDFDLIGITGAQAASSDGSVIVGTAGVDVNGANISAFSGDGEGGFRYTKSNGIDWIVDPASIGPDNSVRPLDVSADGNVIVGDFDLGNKFVDGIFVKGNRGTFRYTDSEGLVELENLDAVSAISLDGSVIVGDSNNEAALYTNSGGVVKLGFLPGGEVGSSAVDVSADGSIIVGYSSSAKGDEAFIWDADSNTMQSLYDVLIADGLDLSEWSDLGITAISDDGSTVVGSGTHNGISEAFAARMFVVPVPATIWLMGTALLGLLGFQRKHAS
jgi:uncharacterized membrane protein